MIWHVSMTWTYGNSLYCCQRLQVSVWDARMPPGGTRLHQTFGSRGDQGFTFTLYDRQGEFRQKVNQMPLEALTAASRYTSFHSTYKRTTGFLANDELSLQRSQYKYNWRVCYLIAYVISITSTAWSLCAKGCKVNRTYCAIEKCENNMSTIKLCNQIELNFCWREMVQRISDGLLGLSHM